MLAEGTDARIVEGAVKAANEKIADIILLGDRAEIAARITAAGAMPSHFELIDPKNHGPITDFEDDYFNLRRHKGATEEDAARAVREPLTLAAMLVRNDYAGGAVAGAANTTADTIRAALQILGKHPDTKIVSSFFFMLLDKDHHTRKEALVFSDAGMNIDPGPQALAEIAIASADSYRQMTGETPRVAMLSFSTHGSASHAHVDKVQMATELVKTARPDLLISGELQFDAAFVPEIAASKAPLSPIQGDANVFVFPGLEAANIGYKIAQRIGGATAIGPILQGLAKPANDLSRGCTAQDVCDLIAITGAQLAKR